MTISLRNKVVILCEGKADSLFLQKLLPVRPDIPPVDFLPHADYYGVNNIFEMLRALKGTGRLFKELKGVLIVADSHDDPKTTFDTIIVPQIVKEGFPKPPGLMQVAHSPDYPGVAVTLIPDDATSGGLESLFIRAITLRDDWIEPCIEEFLKHEKIPVLNWNPEKRDKAKYHTMVAITHKDDPSRAAAYAFRDPPVIPVESPSFATVLDRIKSFCDMVGA